MEMSDEMLNLLGLDFGVQVRIGLLFYNLVGGRHASHAYAKN